MQTKWQSFRESVCNTMLAFGVSFLAHKYLVAPELNAYIENGGNNEDWIAAFAITTFYTLLSLTRNYVIRRWFNKR